MEPDLPVAIDINGWHTIHSAVVAIQWRSSQHIFIANHWRYLSMWAKLNENHQHKYNRYFIAEQIFVIWVQTLHSTAQAGKPKTQIPKTPCYETHHQLMYKQLMSVSTICEIKLHMKLGAVCPKAFDLGDGKYLLQLELHNISKQSLVKSWYPYYKTAEKIKMANWLN